MDLRRRHKLLTKGHMLLYALVNALNGKAYIGQTRHSTLSKRWCPGLRNSANSHLKAAIAKYGPQSFQRTILAECDTQAQLDVLERVWIAVLQTCDREHGYNMQYGGIKWNGGHTPEARQKISRPWTMNQREKSAQIARLQWQNRTMAERTEFGLKISLGKKGRPSTKKGKKYGPQKNPCLVRRTASTTAKQRISAGLKRYWASKRELNEKKPVVGIKDYGRKSIAQTQSKSRQTGV
jgi:group I intron endonuclease